MLSIEEAWEEFDKASVNAWEWHPRVEVAVRSLALAVHWEMVEIIRPLAPLVGKTNMAALYKANDAGVALRAEIENLGK